MPSHVNAPQIEKTTFDRHLRDLPDDYEGHSVKEKNGADALRKLRGSVEKVRHHTKLFRINLPSYNDLFKTELSEHFGVFLITLGDATKGLVKIRGLKFNESIHVNFSVIDELFQMLETELSHV